MRITGLAWVLVVFCLAGSARSTWGQVGSPVELGSREPAEKLATTGGRPLLRAVAGADPARVTPGETINDAILISSLPYSDAGETCDNIDDYDAACTYVSTSPDIVYAFTPPTNMYLDIDLCGSDYDTKLYLLDAFLNVLACNEDYYPPDDPCGSYVSRLQGAAVVGGQTVYIVVDGYAGICGNYQINVADFTPCVLACAGDLIEGEPTLRANYVDRFNSGCNGTSLVPPITTLQGNGLGELSFCGVSGFYSDATNHRDTDWFAFTLGSTGVATWNLNAEQVIVGYVLELDCTDPDVYGVVVGGPCESGSLEIIGYPGASLGLWVAPPDFTPPIGMTGNEFDYEFTLTGLSSHQAVAVELVAWGTIKSYFR